MINAPSLPLSSHSSKADLGYNVRVFLSIHDTACGQKGQKVMNFPSVTIDLPTWVVDFLDQSQADNSYPTHEARMKLAIALAERNVQEKTGGPFGAAVFNLETGELIAPGMNLVVPSNCALLHAEMVAIALAQQVVGTFDLGAPGYPPYGLYTSAEPCAMCFGAVPWSGVRLLACAARTADVQAIGFDEGPKLANWAKALAEREIQVLQDVCRPAGVAVLQAYAASTGVIYNGRGNN